MDERPVLECRNLVKEFKGTRAVDHLDLRVPAARIFGLLGPNGSGKTTTIRMALGIVPPDSGEVALLGSRDPLSVRDRVGYLPEERGLYAKMKVQEQLAFLGTIRGLSLSEADRAASEWLEKLGLSDRARSATNELSKGMRQKIQFASAMLHQPELLILDEPFSGLDPINSRILKKLILEQRDQGRSIILSTHRMEQVEAMCDSICLIHRGRPVLEGSLREIKSSYGRNSIAIEYEGELPEDAIPGVVHLDNQGNRAHLTIDRDADTQEVLRFLAGKLYLHSFRVEEPHIEEIYLDKIEDARPDAFPESQA